MTDGARVRVDPELCMGSGNCLYWADGVFDLGDDGIAHVVGDPADRIDRVQLAVDNCPTGAITLET